MNLDVEASGHCRSLQHSREAGRCEWCPSLRDEHEGRCWCFPLETTQCSHFAAGQGMSAGSAVLRPADVQDSLSEIDLIPSEIAQFGHTQAVPEGDQDHRGIPVPVAVFAYDLDEAFDLFLGQVLPSP
jgi:hypothetical protein